MLTTKTKLCTRIRIVCVVTEWPAYQRISFGQHILPINLNRWHVGLNDVEQWELRSNCTGAVWIWRDDEYMYWVSWFLNWWRWRKFWTLSASGNFQYAFIGSIGERGEEKIWQIFKGYASSAVGDRKIKQRSLIRLRDSVKCKYVSYSSLTNDCFDFRCSL